MYRTAAGLVFLLSGVAAWAENTPVVSQSAESQVTSALVTQTLIAEIRQLRQDLYVTSVTIQRVQIALFRTQSQTALLDRASERRDRTRAICEAAQQQQKRNAAQVERAETARRDAKDQAEKETAEQMLEQMKLFGDEGGTQAQECQSTQREAESQFQLEQARMNELQEQLNKLDSFLARSPTK